MFSQDMYQPLKYARVEQERRFLLKTLPEDLDPEKVFFRIIDQYISGTRLRLRRIESPLGEILVYKFGQKYQTADQKAHQTMMTNMYLTEMEYQALARLGGATISKRRYRYDYAGNDYAIDVFEGNLEGLILMEIESQSDNDITLLPIPAIAAREVTDDPLFRGGELAKLSKEEFRQWFLGG